MNAPETQADMLVSDDSSKEPSHMVVRVSSLAVKMVFPFAAVDDIRYYLNGVNIRPLDDGGAMITATDGHRFIVVRDPNGFCEAEVIAAVSKDAIKHAEAGTTFDVMSNGSAIWNDKVVQPLFIQPGNSLIEGDYPRIESVVDITGYQEGIQGAVNANYLAEVTKIKTGAKTPSVRFFTRDVDAPLLFVFDGIGEMECFGGIMKMRESHNWLPKWLPARGEFTLSKTGVQK